MPISILVPVNVDEVTIEFDANGNVTTSLDEPKAQPVLTRQERTRRLQAVLTAAAKGEPIPGEEQPKTDRELWREAARANVLAERRAERGRSQPLRLTITTKRNELG